MKKISLILAVCVCTVCLSLFGGCSDRDKELKSVSVSGFEIKCNMDMSEVLKAFKGLEFDYSESISCAYDGMDKIYDFKDSGFVVSTYPDGDKDFVLEVSVNKEGIKQLGGKVYVSMSKDEVVSLFGNGYSQDGDVMTYRIKGSDKQTMYFLITDSAVEEYGISVAE